MCSRLQQSSLLYLVGTAGSGKSTMVKSFQDWLGLRGLECVCCNLDPGVESLPYEPDVDIRDWVNLSEVMSEYGLGPNGAQLAAADMIAGNIGEVREVVEGFKSDFVLVDTPGQLELFVFRPSGSVIVDGLGRESAGVAYLVDPVLSQSPSGFVSQLLLSMSAMFRLNVPQMNVLSKADFLEGLEKQDDVGCSMVERIVSWADDPELLYAALIEEDASLSRELNEGVLRLLEGFGGYSRLLPVSREQLRGIDDMYAVVQQWFAGSSDVLKD